MMNGLIRFILRQSGWVLLFCALSTVPCIYWTARLYGNLKPDLEELLPRKSRSVLDLTEIKNRLQTIDYLAVLVFTENPAAGKKFTIDLANQLEKSVPDVVAAVEYKIGNELKFFKGRKALFLELNDLKAIQKFIEQKIHYERSLYNPLYIINGEELHEPSFDFKALLQKYESQSAGFDHFPEGYYATPNGKQRAVLAYLPASQGGSKGMTELKTTTESIIARLDPHSYSPDMKIKYTGGVQVTLEELKALVEDVEKSAEIVFLVVTLLLYLFFRSWLATIALFISLFIARFWTFAFGWFSIGYLNANSAFMGSIVLGSGITFGVILLSRYLEERRNGRIPLRAAKIAMTRTARPTLTAALAAGGAYGSLFLTQFEGFRQYGILGFTGMVFCWVSSVLVFPALLIQIEKRKSMIQRTTVRNSWILNPLCWVLKKYPTLILSLSTLLTLFSIYELSTFKPTSIIETNLANLRNKKTMTEGGGALFKRLDEIFQHYLTPLAILTQSTNQARQVESALKQAKSSDPMGNLISSVQTMDRFVPSDQPKKIQVLKQIQKSLPPSILGRLNPTDREKILTLLTPEVFHPFTQRDLPKLVLNKFTEKDGSVGKMVLVEPPLTNDTWGAKEIEGFIHLLRETSDRIGSQMKPQSTLPIAGGLAVSSDLLEAVSRDGPRATAFAFIAVVILVIVIFRKPSVVSLMLFAFALGNLWMFGIMIAFGLKINFLNFIALPITFGIGVDYGVNIFHRYRHDPSKDILKVVRETGGAVGLCSLTTITGYSSLLIAGNQAFVSFGRLAVLGEVTSLIAAIVTLPAFLLVVNKRKKKPKTQHSDRRKKLPSEPRTVSRNPGDFQKAGANSKTS